MCEKFLLAISNLRKFPSSKLTRYMVYEIKELSSDILVHAVTPVRQQHHTKYQSLDH